MRHIVYTRDAGFIVWIPQNKAVIPAVCNHPFIPLCQVGNDFARGGNQADIKRVTAAAFCKNIGIQAVRIGIGHAGAVNLQVYRTLRSLICIK